MINLPQPDLLPSLIQWATARPSIRAIALFRRVAIGVGERLGYAYPHELHRRVSEYVEHIRQLAPPIQADTKDS